MLIDFLKEECSSITKKKKNEKSFELPSITLAPLWMMSEASYILSDKNCAS